MLKQNQLQKRVPGQVTASEMRTCTECIPGNKQHTALAKQHGLVRLKALKLTLNARPMQFLRIHSRVFFSWQFGD